MAFAVGRGHSRFVSEVLTNPTPQAGIVRRDFAQLLTNHTCKVVVIRPLEQSCDTAMLRKELWRE